MGLLTELDCGGGFVDCEDKGESINMNVAIGIAGDPELLRLLQPGKDKFLVQTKSIDADEEDEEAWKDCMRFDDYFAAWDWCCRFVEDRNNLRILAVEEG
jgi:hypothetical protein